ncbi:hypothetical protein FACS1894204_12630 [Synergistales bacterium]|nr:hypothetical protein FACS1894204_12630 [Synergistales bacterium]
MTKRDKFGSYVAGAWVAIGGLLIICFTVYSAARFYSDINGYAETSGVIFDIRSRRAFEYDAPRTAYVKYKVDGVSYETNLGYYSSGMRRGKKVKIYYDPKSPGGRVYDGSYGGVHLLFTPLGVIFLAVGVWVIRRAYTSATI